MIHVAFIVAELLGGGGGGVASNPEGLGLIPGLGVLSGLSLLFSGFPRSSKSNISKFQFHLESEGHKFVSLNRLLCVTLINQQI